jgi:CTP:molybdopterin cytidylyltransferase MocA
MAYVSYASAEEEIIRYCQNLDVGDKIKFVSEKQRYTVQANSGRFVICTKPFNVRKTYLYTVIDLERNVRGALNLIFGTIHELNNPEGAKKCIEDLKNGDYEVSHRNCIKLDVEWKKGN